MYIQWNVYILNEQVDEFCWEPQCNQTPIKVTHRLQFAFLIKNMISISYLVG